MTPIKKVIYKKDASIKPIWLMRQAGRYLPEFRKVRKNNPDFIKLCLNSNKINDITLQPLKRYNLDAAIIFSDILIVPYAIGQSVEFKKNFGPHLGDFDISLIKNFTNKSFTKKLNPIYESLRFLKKNKLVKRKNLIGFVGGPWTILVYMLNKMSPKKNLKKTLSDKPLIIDLLGFINKCLEVHISNQIKSGADIIQIFDSWAGLVKEKNINDFIYKPTKRLVKFINKNNTPSICFPRNVKNYKEYVHVIKPNVINIDYRVDPKKIVKDINIPIQGGMDPKILLSSKKKIEKVTNYYLETFQNHPYIFNLGHGVLPQTEPNMVEYLINLVRKFNERSSKN